MAERTPDAVLIVDDDEDIQRMLRLAFEAKGYRVEIANDGQVALELLKARPADLVVLDLFMPSLDGWATLARIHKLPQPPPIVILSGASDVNITPRIFREGVGAFIGKPFRLEVLTNTCQELIRRSKGRPPIADERRRGRRRTLSRPVQVIGADDRTLQEGRAVDLSVFGAQVETEAALPPGAGVRLAFPLGDGSSVRFGCEVQWWRRAAPPSNLTVQGLAFKGLSAEDQRAIKELAALE